MAQSRALLASRRLYASLLQLYPPRFKEEYGREMERVFAERCEDAYAARRLSGLVDVWVRSVSDLLLNATLERGSQVKSMPISRGALLTLLIAAALSMLLGYVNLHNDEVQAPLAVLLGSALLGRSTRGCGPFLSGLGYRSPHSYRSRSAFSIPAGQVTHIAVRAREH